MTNNNDKQPKDMVASIQGRLRNVARDSKTDYNRVLTRYGNERFLFRLSQIDLEQKFVLKGATLFTAWTGAPHRNTGDLDLLGTGDNSPEKLESFFQEVMNADVPEDGLVFLPESLKIETRRDEKQYPGLKAEFTAKLGNSRIDLRVDVGFGDAVSPGVVEEEIPPILSTSPAVRLAMYPRQTVVAEKFEAIVSLDVANSRYKDFYDLWFLATQFNFDLESLRTATKATFERRKTVLPTQTPSTLTPEWARSLEATQQWSGFVKRSGLDHDAVPDFPTVAALVWSFLSPLVRASSEDAQTISGEGDTKEDTGEDHVEATALWQWPVGGPWQVTTDSL